MQALSPSSSSLIRPSIVPSQPLRLIALGDSIIYGYGDPEGGGWVERLRRQWMNPEGPDHALYNLGVRGDRVKQINRRLENEFRHRGELRNRVPDRIILSVGVNDSARIARWDGRNYTEFESFQVDLAELLDRALQLCPVLFVGMTPVNETCMPFSQCLFYNLADQLRYTEAIRHACQVRQIPFLDVLALWLHRGESWWKPRLASDGLHPNVNGYRSLLQDVLAWEPIREMG